MAIAKSVMAGGSDNFIDTVPIQNTTGLDYFILVLCFLATAAFIYLNAVVFVKKTKYLPLNTKQYNTLVLMSIVGCIHIWASFVSNDHLKVFIPIKRVNCALWSFWLPFFCGFSVWLSVLIIRSLKYAYIFHQSMSKIDKRDRGWITNASVLAVIAPMFIICLGVTLDGASTYDEELLQCQTNTNWKIAIVIWLSLCIVLLSGLTLYISRGIPHTYFMEYRPLRHILIVGIFILIINSVITFKGWLPYSAGRCMFTFNIIFLHMFSFLRIIGVRLYKAMRKDETYVKKFISSYRIHDLSITKLEELVQDDTLRSKFLDYCRKQPDLNQFANVNNFYSARAMVDCYMDIHQWLLMQKWRLEGNPALKEYVIVNKDGSMPPPFELRSDQINEDDETMEKYDDIIKKYLVQSSVFKINIDPKLETMIYQCKLSKSIKGLAVLQHVIFQSLASVYGKTWMDIYITNMGIIDPEKDYQGAGYHTVQAHLQNINIDKVAKEVIGNIVEGTHGDYPFGSSSSAHEIDNSRPSSDFSTGFDMKNTNDLSDMFTHSNDGKKYTILDDDDENGDGLDTVEDKKNKGDSV